MTSIIGGLIPTGPPEQKERVRKTEGSPPEDSRRDRFKESLEKAMNEPAQETTVENSRKEEPSESSKSEVRDKEKPSVFAEKSPDEGKGKTVRSERSGGEVPAIFDRMENRGVKKNIKAELSGKSLLKESGRGGAVSGTAEKQKAIPAADAMAFKKTDKDGVGVKDREAGELRSKERKESGNESVVIPFPGGAAETNRAASDAASSGIHNQVSGKEVKKVRSSESRENQKPVLTVVDTRSKGAEGRESAQAVTKPASLTETVDQSRSESNQIILGEQTVDGAGAEEGKTFESRFSENREVLLARELKESGNEQIVKKASFILKDSNQGEIKLILKPEALGRVKIQLNMNENNLVGKIIVENSRVGQIFENNLSNLSRTFEEAGISSSSLEVSVGDGNRGDGGGNQSFRKDQPFFSERLKTLDHAVPTTGSPSSQQGSQLINLVV